MKKGINREIYNTVTDRGSLARKTLMRAKAKIWSLLIDTTPGLKDSNMGQDVIKFPIWRRIPALLGSAAAVILALVFFNTDFKPAPSAFTALPGEELIADSAEAAVLKGISSALYLTDSSFSGSINSADGDSVIKVFSGTVYLSFTRKPEFPLTVETADLRIKITGTTLSVSSDGRESRVNLYEGSIAVQPKNSDTGSEFALNGRAAFSGGRTAEYIDDPVLGNIYSEAVKSASAGNRNLPGMLSGTGIKTISLKDGRTVKGIITEENTGFIKVMSSGGKTERISKKDLYLIESAE